MKPAKNDKNPLATHFQDQTVIQIIIQLIAAICLVTMVPIQIIFYYGILSKQANLAEFMWSVIKKHQKSILNWFCVLMIFILFVDTMTGGLFSISSGFNAVNILTSMLYMGNPMMSWMVLFYLGMGFQVSLSVLFANVFLSFLAGFIYTILELNFILYVGRKCDEA